MKISDSTLKQITKDFQKLYDERVKGLPKTLELFNELMQEKPENLCHSFWNKIVDDKLTKNDRLVKTRVFEYDPKFQRYPDGTNDKTLLTGLKKALQSIETKN